METRTRARTLGPGARFRDAVLEAWAPSTSARLLEYSIGFRAALGVDLSS